MRRVWLYVVATGLTRGFLISVVDVPPRTVMMGKERFPKRNDRPKGAGRRAQGKRRGEMMRGLVDVPLRPVVWTEAAEDPLYDIVRLAAKAADGRKASETAAFFIKPLTDIASFIVLANGRSKPQNDAISAAVVEDIEDTFDRRPLRIDGGADGGWTVLDYGDFIVHVMTPLSRAFYKLDDFWAEKGAPQIDLSDVITPETALGPLTDDDLDGASFDFNADDDDDDLEAYLSDAERSLLQKQRQLMINGNRASSNDDIHDPDAPDRYDDDGLPVAL